jgi:steroid 5-alpha reductase family enzyme
MFDLQLWLSGLQVLAVVALIGWLASLRLNDVSIVDSLWSLMFLVAAGTYAMVQPGPLGERAALVLVLVAIWAIRLSAYITWRNRGHGEDFRYRRIRANNEPFFAFKSLYIVFGLQAALAWIVSLPLLAAINSTSPLGWLDAAGVALWGLGLLFEAVGDWQLARFKADPRNHGRVLDHGLWRYTRHPNYFGDFCVWWGFYLIAIAAGGAWSVLGPALMTLLLMRVSGVALLERDIGERRPGYEAYVASTNAFFPGPPRQINRGVR